MRSYTLSKKNGNQIISKIKSKWTSKPNLNINKIRLVEIDKESSILIGEEFTAVKHGKEILPFLKMNELLETYSTIFIDKGAIRPICNGANVMRPGIVKWEGNFKSGDIVAVKDEQHGKIIAVGLALVDSSEIQKIIKGVIIKNLHYVGDKFWKSYKTII